MTAPNKKLKLPADILEKLTELDKELEEEDITIKGYCKRKWILLEQYIPIKTLSNIIKLQASITENKINEKDAYKQMLDLLKIENWFINKKLFDKSKSILRSTENLNENHNLSESKTNNEVDADNSLKNTILNNFLNKVLNKNNENSNSFNSFLQIRFKNKNNNRMVTVIKPSKRKNSEIVIGPQIKKKKLFSKSLTLSDNSKKCNICNQYLDKLVKFNDQPLNAVNELQAIANSKLPLTRIKLRSSDNLPYNKITQFTIYDKEGHLCPFDTDFIGKNTVFYFSGYLIFGDFNSKNEIPVKDVGPIKELWLTGFDKSLNARYGLTTSYSHYILIEPSKEYKPFINISDTSKCNAAIVINNYLNKENKHKTKTIERFKRCNICRQYLNDPRLGKYYGHPKNAINENAALANPKLISLTEKENINPNSNMLPECKITQFSVYDKKGHLCPFDTGLIEKNISLYFSGYLKPMNDENTKSKGGIPVKDMGPITDWWTSGFHTGKNALVGFSTPYGQYYLMEATNEYEFIMQPIWEKVYLSKIIIEYFLEYGWQNPTYKDLLLYLRSVRSPKIGQFTEKILLKHAQFLCEQISNFDTAVKNKNLFISMSCISTIIKLANVTLIEKKKLRIRKRKRIKTNNNISRRKSISKEKKKLRIENREKVITKHKSRRKDFSKATTTDLVRQVFDSFFPEQLDKNKKQNKHCGNCKNCRKKSKNKKTCINRQCLKIEMNESDYIEIDYNESSVPPCISKNILQRVSWINKPLGYEDNCAYYNSAKIGEEIIKSGDYVMLKADESGLPLLVAKVSYMWEQSLGRQMFHAQLFYRGIHTVLGETSDHRELFQVDECEVCPLGSIVKKANVKYKILSVEFNTRVEENNSTFFCQKRYDRKRGRFEDLYDDILQNNLTYRNCASCNRQLEKKMYETPILENNIIKWRGEQYGEGTGVYLLPGTFEFKTAPTSPLIINETKPVDEDLYPEFYRKKAENIIGIEISEPFCIGYITEIITQSSENLKPEDMELKVRKLYRPENTHKGIDFSQKLDINIVYWSDEQVTVPFSTITGKCYIINGNVLNNSAQEWSSQGPNRFYFLQSYNAESEEFTPTTKNSQYIGCEAKLKSNLDIPETWGTLKEPLKTLDVFAGCGGLSEGLHQSGVADTRWAIEKDETAALAYKQNNSETIVYAEDCNALLTEIITGKPRTKKNQPLPRKGEVELLVGGPPCQGFSGMNRFNAGQYSLFKNSLIVSYLSYCDYYKPKFFILENVRNFVTFKKSMVLKLTLRCLLAMGYQCTFGVLQAGNYGVPQIRRRSIIIAAAPGEILPEYPEPLHVFTSKRANPLDIVIDNCRYNTGLKWLDYGAPYRTVTVRDAMSDLPEIPNGCCDLEQMYNSEPLSHFQRVMRKTKDNILKDHICKEMAPLVEARISYIPKNSGSDWRDLPNIEIKLSDGTTTNKLKYNWHDKRNGKNSKGNLRGVCPCASKKRCDPSARQYNSLIPWCLPHTANRHNHWAGLFGRLEWDGVFNTTVTNPEPIGKQGRVLHPVQNRVVSVRECARSQGFPDTYKFYGNVLDKHRQVGNAVPPPLGKAIGQEIIKSIISLNRKPMK